MGAPAGLTFQQEARHADAGRPDPSALYGAGQHVGCTDKFNTDQGIMGMLRGFDLGTWSTCLANPNIVAEASHERISAGAPRPRPEPPPSQAARQAMPAAVTNAKHS